MAKKEKETQKTTNKTTQEKVEKNNVNNTSKNKVTIKTSTSSLKKLIKTADKVSIFNGHTKSIREIKKDEISDSLLLQPNTALIIKLKKDNEGEIFNARFIQDILNMIHVIEYKNDMLIIRNIYAPQYLDLETEIEFIKLVVD